MSFLSRKAASFCFFLTCAILLPVKLHSQIVEVTTKQGDDLLAVHRSDGDRTMFDIYDKKDLTLRIATYDYLTKKTTNVDLDHVDEVKRYVDGIQNMTNRSIGYKGPAPTGSSAPAPAVQAPPATPPATPPVAALPATTNIYANLPPPTFEIVSADAKKAAGSALKGFGDALGNSMVGRTQGGSTATMKGAAAVRMQISDKFGDHVAMFYSPNGKPMTEDARSAGETTGKVVSHWDKAALADLGNKLRDYVKAKGEVAEYADTLDAMGDKPVTAAN
jgi:hypothetical protein